AHALPILQYSWSNGDTLPEMRGLLIEKLIFDRIPRRSEAADCINPAAPMSFLFVYGTLLPGHAPAAMRDVVASLRPVGPATVRGRLYHLGAYPGLVLDAGDASGVVHGMLLE